jgi:precorrin-2 C20-methyltransferase
MKASGTLYGVGVGPGDPELLTLKAVRIIQAAQVLAYPANRQGYSQAREIAARWLSPGQRELPIVMPFQRDRSPANQAYELAAEILAEALAEGQDVAVLCEGDPLLFGSFIYLQRRLAGRFPCAIVPGITSITAAAAISGLPLSSQHERIAILPASAGETAMEQALQDYDSVILMKPGRHRPLILELLQRTGRARDAVYIEQASQAGQRIVRSIAEIPATPGPYFALFLVTRGGTS